VFANFKPIQVDVVEYLDKTIEMYKHWGFEVDESKGTTTYPWSMWPKEAVEAYRGIFMRREGMTREEVDRMTELINNLLKEIDVSDPKNKDKNKWFVNGKDGTKILL
jgi:hypothetical protein